MITNVYFHLIVVSFIVCYTSEGTLIDDKWNRIFVFLSALPVVTEIIRNVFMAYEHVDNIGFLNLDTTPVSQYDSFRTESYCLALGVTYWIVRTIRFR